MENVNEIVEWVANIPISVKIFACVLVGISAAVLFATLIFLAWMCLSSIVETLKLIIWIPVTLFSLN